MNNLLFDPSAGTLIQKWTDKMEPYRCVEIAQSSPEIFDEQ